MLQIHSTPFETHPAPPCQQLDPSAIAKALARARTVALARAVIAEFLIFLATVSAFWFASNCPYHYGFSLCSRLGLAPQDFKALMVAANLANVDKNGVFIVNYKEWTNFVGGGDFAFMHDRVECDSKKFHFENHLTAGEVALDRTEIRTAESCSRPNQRKIFWIS